MTQSLFVVGMNAPGYAPDCEPTECDSWAEAQEMLRAEIAFTLASLDPEGAHYSHSDLEAIGAEIAATAPGDHAWTILGLAHWVQAWTRDA